MIPAIYQMGRLFYPEEYFLNNKESDMSMLSGFVSDKLFQMVLSEIEAHEPEVQAALLNMAGKVLTSIVAKIEAHLQSATPKPFAGE